MPPPYSTKAALADLSRSVTGTLSAMSIQMDDAEVDAEIAAMIGRARGDMTAFNPEEQARTYRALHALTAALQSVITDSRAACAHRGAGEG